MRHIKMLFALKKAEVCNYYIEHSGEETEMVLY